MEKLKYEFFYWNSKCFEGFSEAELSAVKKAKATCNNSYSPYSNFRVAAVAILESGEIIGASNQESEVFPSGMCAERVLLYYLLSNFSNDKIVTLLIYSDSSEIPCTPCGACRQVIADARKRQKGDIKIIMCNSSEAIIVKNSDTLLPFSFSLQ